MILKAFTSKLKNYEISVEIDNLLIRPGGRDLYHIDKLTSNNITVNINLFQLIYAIGTVQARRFNPSNRQKFTDYEYLIEKIKDEIELKIKLTEVRNILDSEKLGDLSEDLGVGVAVCVSDYLYGLEKSTLTKISGKGLRPDMKAFTKINHEIVIESKGSATSETSLMGRLPHAIDQKRAVLSDISVVSLTLLNENDVCKNWFYDPPNINNEGDWKMRKAILKAQHYASAFSFIGQSQLSKYFSYMSKKIEDGSNVELINQKERLFNKIKKDYIAITISNNLYYGTIEKIEDGTYQFLGVNESLLSYEGFINFEEKYIDETVKQDKNLFYLFKDGICIGEIKDLTPYDNQLKNKSIKYYQENTRISDLDYMNALAFIEYISYLFKQNDFIVEVVDGSRDMGIDLIVKKYGKQFNVQIKQMRPAKEIGSLDRIACFASNSYPIIFITNARLNKRLKVDKSLVNQELNMQEASNYFIVIDRDKLKEIIFENKKLESVIFG